ncbi:g13384 [Coccomyxa viridis]|uniref:G13384 protein n=1 Tax=Coccomyxa viridis TaxID=1274662 RepID=A0ABP1GCM1_9CHLO
MAYGDVTAAALPDDSDELQQMTVLARDAAEILFEMAAMQDKSPEAYDMLEKSQQIEAQLRGMIGDFKGGDEVLLSQALEAFDTLTNTTTEYRAALGGKSTGIPAAGSSAAGGVPNLQPPSSNPFQKGAFGSSNEAPIVTAPGQKPDKDDEPALISFD